MSFSLCAMVAEHSKRDSRPQNLRPGADASAIHGQLSAPVALLQSRILSAVQPEYATAPVQPSQEEIPCLALNHSNQMV